MHEALTVHLAPRHREHRSKFPLIHRVMQENPGQAHLHRDVVDGLHDALKGTPHMLIVWPKDLHSSGEKLAALNAMRDQIADHVSGLVHIPRLKTNSQELLFWVAKTVTVSTFNGKHGLVTDFVDSPDATLSTLKKKLAVVALNHPEGHIYKGRTKIQDMSAALQHVTGKDLDRLSVSSEHFDLDGIGAAPGIVGPWCRPGVVDRVVFLRYLDSSNETRTPVIDFALGTNVSLLIPEMLQAEHLPYRTAASLGIPSPTFVDHEDFENVA